MDDGAQLLYLAVQDTGFAVLRRRRAAGRCKGPAAQVPVRATGSRGEWGELLFLRRLRPHEEKRPVQELLRAPGRRLDLALAGHLCPDASERFQDENPLWVRR